MKLTAYDGTTTLDGKYDNNGNDWYFRFDDDNKMSHKF